MSEQPTHAEHGIPSRLTRPADHWGLVLTYGLVTFGLGLVLAVWPGETLKVCAVLIAVQLLIAGVVRLVSAAAASGLDGGMRALLALTGALALIAGLLCLRDPLQTLLVIGLIVGAWWLVSGVVDVLGGILAPAPGRRVWEIASGVVSILAGGFLLANPELSLGVLVLVTCVWLFAAGLVAIVAAFRLRADRTPAADVPVAAPTAPAH